MDDLNKILYEISPGQRIPFYYYIISKWSLVLLALIGFFYEISYLSISFWMMFVFLILYQKTILKKKDIYKSPLILLYANVLKHFKN